MKKSLTIDEEENSSPTPPKTYMFFFDSEKNLAILKPTTESGEFILNQHSAKLLIKELENFIK